MSQKKLMGYAGMVTLVAGGVILGGYIMNEFNSVKFIAKSQNGYQGVA